MNNLDSKLNEENENVKELLNFSNDETQLKHIKEVIQNSENGPYYFLHLLELYTLLRPHQHQVSIELM